MQRALKAAALLLAPLTLGACADNLPRPPPTASAPAPVAGAAAAATNTGAEKAPVAAASPAMPVEAPAPVRPDYDRNVYFAPGKAELDERGRSTLSACARRLRENGKLTISLLAFTDHLGSRSINLAVAEQRLRAVESFLRSQGVAQRQIRRSGMGTDKLRPPRCTVESCRQAMRRVELTVH